jgi:Sec-independent protein translocase protein TatA
MIQTLAYIGPGGPEFMFVMLVLLLMFGAKDAPRILRKLNEIFNQIRNTADSFKREVMYGDLSQSTPTYEPTIDDDSADDYDHDDDYDYNEDDYYDDDDYYDYEEDSEDDAADESVKNEEVAEEPEAVEEAADTDAEPEDEERNA